MSEILSNNLPDKKNNNFCWLLECKKINSKTKKNVFIIVKSERIDLINQTFY